MFTLSDGVFKAVKDFWFCNKCRHWKRSEAEAEACCTPKHCETCKKEMDAKYFHTICNECRDKASFDKAELVPYDGGPFLCVDDDEYYNSEEEFLDRYDGEAWEDVPVDLRPCKEVKWPGINAQSVYENACEDLPENENGTELQDQIVDTDEYFAFMTAWNNKQTITYFESDMKKKIVIEKPKDWPGEEDDGEVEQGKEGT